MVERGELESGVVPGSSDRAFVQAGVNTDIVTTLQLTGDVDVDRLQFQTLAGKTGASMPPCLDRPI